MLTRIYLFIILFLCGFLVFGNKLEDSILHSAIYKEIDLFRFSNQKKYLHAIISNEIGILGKNGDNNIVIKLKYSFVQDLLNNGFYKEAFQLLNEIGENINLNDPFQAKDYYTWLANAYRMDNQLIDAHVYFDSAVNECKKTNDLSCLGTIYFDIGMTYQREGKRNEAFIYYQKANDLIKEITYSLIESKRRISSTLSLRKKHDKALIYINEALDLCADKDSVIVYGDSIWDYGIYAAMLQSRAYAYREMAKEGNDSLKYLYLSLNDAKASIQAFEKYKRGFVFESDIIFSNSEYLYFYYKSIEAISRIYDATQSESLLIDALQYAEMDKSSALVRTVQKEIALNQSGIPDSSIFYLKDLYERLSKVEAKRYEENANTRVNDTALYALNMELYDLVSEITQMEKRLEKDYLIYGELKYKVTPPNLDFIMEESFQKAIFEYVVSNEKLYVFLIVDGVIHFNHFYFNKNFIPSINRLHEMISNYNKIDFSLKELNEFETLSYGLYIDLIQPFETFIEGKQLLIVPDEQLSLIPFEVLLNRPSESKILDYSSLPYLVKTNNISYAYSLTLQNKQKSIKTEAKYDQLLAMAPGYEKLAGNQGAQYIALRGAFRDARDKLGMLEGAKEEAKQVSRKVKSRLILENGASEEQFKLLAPNYKVLHLAMHTLINNEDPMYSKLVFTPDVDELEDGLLNTYELNNMHLNADLVVLSACNTGFGKLNTGEGIIGLSRGFLQAGCKSLLATLWSVADEASVTLISNYYEGLQSNLSKSESLSGAKRNYLNNTKGMEAHPFFWAAYVSIGSDNPIQMEKNYDNAIIYLTLIAFTLIVLAWLLYKQKSRNKIPAFRRQTKQTVS